MSAPRDGVSTLIDSVRRRLAARDVLRAGATAAFTAAVLLLAGVYFRADVVTRIVAAVGFGGAAALLEIGRSGPRTARAAAHEIERRAGSLRNLLVTAEELLAAPERTAPYMLDRVLRAAAAAAATIEPRRVVPLGAASAAAALALVVLAGSARMRYLGGGGSPLSPAPGVRAAAAATLEIDVMPPSYTGRPAQRLRNPPAVEALAGSAIAIRVAGVADARVRLNGASIAAAADGAARATLLESGAIAVDGGDVHAVLPLTVVPDAAPDVRVTVPARDLRVGDAKASIPVHAAATDDLALRALAFRYTVVSGGGEEFTFKEGTLAASVAKQSDRAWAADATISLAALHLEPGDALVYRAVASDRRPGSAGEASSDTYFIEIAGPGDVPLEGIDMPPDKERYALSEAMIVVKLQRLIAAQAGMRREDVEEAAANIAAEQRAVRANFVFMLGGEVEDEVVEAETSHEIQEGRLANQARREIVAATLLMGKVEQALAAGTTRAALPLAEDAVRALQRAFGHSRYLLRALPSRIRIDPARRLSGDLAAVNDWRRDLVPAADDPHVEAARSALAELVALSSHLETGATERLARLAERVLGLDPGAADVQQASRQLVEARAALARGDLDRARAALRSSAAPIVQRAGRGRIDAPRNDADALRLAGAAALAGGGGR